MSSSPWVSSPVDPTITGTTSLDAASAAPATISSYQVAPMEDIESIRQFKDWAEKVAAGVTEDAPFADAGARVDADARLDHAPYAPARRLCTDRTPKTCAPSRIGTNSADDGSSADSGYVMVLWRAHSSGLWTIIGLPVCTT